MAGAGASGYLQSRFEDGLRFLGVALALRQDQRHPGAVVSAACDALRCFLEVLEAAASRRLGDPDGGVLRLGEQCRALLDPGQGQDSAVRHALEAACLARDEAARLLPALLGGPQ